MRFIWLFFILSAGLFASCNNYKVVSFNNPDFKDSNYNSYKIITKVPDSLLLDQKTIINEVHTAITDEMKIRGYELIPQKSDLILRYKFFSNNRTELTNNFRNRSIYDPRMFSYQARNVNESILLIDIHDRVKEKLVWQGSVDLNLSFSKKQNAEDIIPKIVNEIFSTYQLKSTQ